jgi:peroxiredoxin Q/BCP
MVVQSPTTCLSQPRITLKTDVQTLNAEVASPTSATADQFTPMVPANIDVQSTSPLGSINGGRNIAPDFILHSTQKNPENQEVMPFHLYEALKNGPVVLFFFPSNKTPFCQKQLQAFRDSYSRFQALGATVVGISSDPVKSQQQAISQERLPFDLLSDPDDTVRKQFNAQSLWGLLPSRKTFVIAPDAQIFSTYSSQTNISEHIGSALSSVSALKSLNRLREEYVEFQNNKASSTKPENPSLPSLNTEPEQFPLRDFVTVS